MNQASSFVRPLVREMPAYEAVPSIEQLLDDLGLEADELVKLDANENPYGALPEVQAALGNLAALQFYPDPESRGIRRRLAQYHGVAGESIVLGAGLDEVIDLILRACVDPGEAILNCPPTFSMYAFDGMLHRARMLNVPRREDFSLDVAGIQKAVEREKPKLMILANPNNPDGSVISKETFRQLAGLPLLLVIDEAYIQFTGEDRSVIDEVEKRDNLIVLRTFSKWAGLAGLRIGYGVFPLEIAAALMKIKQPYNVSVTAELAASVTMDNVAKTRDVIQRICDQRENLYSELKKIDWLEPYPSQANFILCKIKGKDTRQIQQILRGQGILVRCFDGPDLRNSLRISVGTADQVQKLITALKGIG